MNVFVQDTRGIVYSWHDACTLREKYRIVGNLFGCLPQKPRQNNNLSLPLQLLPEEVTLLKDLGVVRLLDGTQPLKLPLTEEKLAYEAHSEKVYSEQVEACRQERLAAIERRKDAILEGKRTKRRKLQDNETGEMDKEEELLLSEIDITLLARKSSFVQIPTEAYRESSKTYKEVEWSFPATDMEKLRYDTFKDLWHKGHFLTGGVKFGGDFLVYPGDPARYHSFYIAVCVPQHAPLTALQLASTGRLGSTVKKTVLICSLDSDNKVNYLSLNWAHIS